MQLFAAVVKDDMSGCIAALKAGANVNSHGQHQMTPLMRAAEQGHEDVFALLITHGADVCGSDGNMTLCLAASAGAVSACATLLDRGIDAYARDTRGYTPLVLAAGSGHAAVCTLLIERGTNVNACSVNGETPLMWAAHNGHADTCALLIHHGAGVNARTCHGNTSLMWAAQHGHVAACNLLIQHGADVNARAKYDFTPLLHAACRARAETCTLLIERGADVNARNNVGCSPLLYAAQRGLAPVCALLIACGADVNGRADSGTTPLAAAAHGCDTAERQLESCEGGGTAPLDACGLAVMAVLLTTHRVDMDAARFEYRPGSHPAIARIDCAALLPHIAAIVYPRRRAVLVARKVLVVARVACAWAGAPQRV